MTEQQPYELQVDREALAYFQRLDAATQRRILARLDQIAENPLGPFTKQLANPGGRRSSRVGGWRIIFSVDQAERTVFVSLIDRRGQVYREL